jgi:hypothetical protein
MTEIKTVLFIKRAAFYLFYEEPPKAQIKPGKAEGIQPESAEGLRSESA